MDSLSLKKILRTLFGEKNGYLLVIDNYITMVFLQQLKGSTIKIEKTIDRKWYHHLKLWDSSSFKFLLIYFFNYKY